MFFVAVNIMLAAGSASEESSLFSPDQFAGYAVTAVMTAVNLIVAYIVIKRFIVKPILKMIHNRQDALNNELEEATKSKEEADNVVATSKTTIDDARRKAAEIIDEARDNANRQSDLIVKKANEDAASIVDRAEEDVIRMKRVALEDMKDDITDIAVQIAQKVIGDAIPKAQLVESATVHTNEAIEAEVRKSE
ncbi:MAG: F0F1 ATP synthase subunit B [Saccharofermentans sp.]|jgi:F-type H+-transporting ATPase subunit b|nr:F0F1 ATP synthase subunit B [Mageeibacillus sp.]MCI1263645.1 F0F1 ATP synthase subunit B [Saccharofermentans sp.]MCI1274730.1 F0F1 ATP synthase subunit B [Saccharofermentans sp.]MCI1769344.1 F0F1 ATP synthase subunit B [Mageeibacillus sp.]MCI2043657.1 F0F1 ATP synthase subunit B [Mageeibacillus sp.]